MAKEIDFDALADRISEHGFAYLITVGENDRIHTSPVTPVVTGDHLAVMSPSARVQANTGARPNVSLVWPPAAAGGYSLIVDGEARTDTEANALVVATTRAVLHRPAPRPESGGGEQCGSDCIEL